MMDVTRRAAGFTEISACFTRHTRLMDVIRSCSIRLVAAVYGLIAVALRPQSSSNNLRPHIDTRLMDVQMTRPFTKKD